MIDHNYPPESGPFGMGWQGYVIIAIVIVVTVLYAATRRDWMSMLVSALVPPLIFFPLIFALSRHGREGTRGRDRRGDPGKAGNILTFLARTNPIMFLLLGSVRRREDDEQYRQLVSAGPYTLGRQGYLILTALIFLPLICTLIISVVSGQLPSQSSPHFH